MHLGTVVVALTVAAMLLSGCAATPAGPRPTLPHPSYAPVRLPAKSDATPAAARGDGKRGGATTRPAAMTEAEWRARFCATQDTVFALAFALSWVASVGEARDVAAFRRSIKVLDGRVAKARRALLSVPARYAGPLVSAELRFLKGLDQMAARFMVLIRTRSPREVPRIRAAAHVATRGWKDMVRINRQLQEGPHRLVCL